MASIMPPVPYKTKFLNSMGFLSDPWSRFFRDLYRAVGGRISGSTRLTGDLAFDIQLLNSKLDELEKAPVP